MKITTDQILSHNKKQYTYVPELNFLRNKFSKTGISVDEIIRKVADFQVAIPSWALGAGGTRFGRFSIGGEPISPEQKLEDIGVLHSLTKTAGAVSLHIPWDTPKDIKALKELAAINGILFDAMNSNTFQDQPNAELTYKFGSLSSSDNAVREYAIQHNIDVIKIGKELGSKSLTVWLADGTNFPGQKNFRTALTHTENSLQIIYNSMPEDWKMFIEYKPFEPYFYSTVIQDWGTSFMLANGCGERAYTLVDLGHHLPNTNIEQIVATLILKGKLGGFHFNDSKYGDDDVTVGSINPYALFLIFNELVYEMESTPQKPDLSFMIDASHNTKDPLEDLIQSLEAILISYAKALLVDQKELKSAQQDNDVAKCQEILQNAYRCDVRSILKAAREKTGGAIDPLDAYRKIGVRKALIKERGEKSIATGL